MAVDLLVTGGVARFGSVHVATVRVLDVSAARVVARGRADLGLDEEAWVAAAQTLVDRLFPTHADAREMAVAEAREQALRDELGEPGRMGIAVEGGLALDALDSGQSLGIVGVFGLPGDRLEGGLGMLMPHTILLDARLNLFQLGPCQAQLGVRGATRAGPAGTPDLPKLSYGWLRTVEGTVGARCWLQNRFALIARSGLGHAWALRSGWYLPAWVGIEITVQDEMYW